MKRREFLRVTASAAALTPLGGLLATSEVTQPPETIGPWVNVPHPMQVPTPEGLTLQELTCYREMMHIAPMRLQTLEELRSKLGIDTFAL